MVALEEEPPLVAPIPVGNAVLSVYAFLFAGGLAGPISPAAARLFVVLALAGALFVGHRRDDLAATWSRVVYRSLPLFPAVLAGLAVTPGHGLQVLGVVASLSLSAWLAVRTATTHWRWRLARGMALTALVWLAVRHVNAARWMLEVVAGVLSSLGRVVSLGMPLDVGPTFSGLWVALPALCLVLPASGWRPSRRLLFAIAASVALLAGYIALLPSLEVLFGGLLNLVVTPPAPHRPVELKPGVTAGFGVLFLVPLLVPVILAIARPTTTGDRQTVASPRRRPRRALAGLLLVAVGGIGATWTHVSRLSEAPKVTFFERGSLDFSTPTTGVYGLIRLGMFGVLQTYLEAAGYETGTVDGLAPGVLDETDVVVIINPRDRFTDAEVDALWSYVRSGGGLLVMGDHTDLFGLQEPLAHLLEPLDIELEFDSAFPLRKHWRFCQSLRPHPLTSGLRDYRDTRIGTGASLTLGSLRAQPVVVGRYAFGDLGNRANDGQGGFLGDYRYQVGERLGDVVLVATADYGAGRVTVFGDTSMFQSLYLPEAWIFVERTFRHLARGGSRGWWRWVFGLVLLVGCGLVVAGRPPTASIALALTLGVATSPAELARAEPPPLDGRLASIDTAHVGRVPFELWEDASIGGLSAGLFRAGYLEVPSRERDPERLDDLDLVAYVAPVKLPSIGERHAIERLLQRGGTVLVAAAGRHREAANRFLDLCGMRVLPRPLGPAEIEQIKADQSIQFVDAWALDRSQDQPWTVHAQFNGEALVAERRVGPGRCLAFGDARFFEDSNLEGEYDFKHGNVVFLESLLRAPGNGS